MPVHSLHIFDRKGKTLFTKRYVRDENEPPDLAMAPSKDSPQEGRASDAVNEGDVSAAADRADYEDQLEEQRKLIFGMLFSLREVANSLSPSSDGGTDRGLHSVSTGASTLFHFETNSGLRFSLYVTHVSTIEGASGATGALANSSAIRAALKYVADELWIQCVVRSPLYTPAAPNVSDTNFEGQLDQYFKSQAWFR
jgi:trafficking protein particle complex subunit 1